MKLPLLANFTSQVNATCLDAEATASAGKITAKEENEEDAGVDQLSFDETEEEYDSDSGDFDEEEEEEWDEAVFAQA